MAVDLSVFDRLKTKADYDQANQEFLLKKQIAQAAIQKQLTGGDAPAAIQIANEYAKARANGDIQRMNDLALAAKIYDKGVVGDASGSGIQQINGYAPAVAGIEGAKAGAKEQAQKGVDLVMDPQIATGVSNAKNASELQYAQPIQTAKSTAETNAKQQADVNKKALAAGNNLSVIDQILTPDETGKTVLDRATGSGAGALLAGAERFIGKSTDATRANAQLNVFGGQLLNNVPRMEGPQSDRDVESYREQAGKIADPTVPAADKRSALAIIKQLSEKYAAQNTSGISPIEDVLPAEALPPDMGASVAGAPPVTPAVQAAQAPKAGTVEGGYLFMGGDPSQKSNWKKVK